MVPHDCGKRERESSQPRNASHCFVDSSKYWCLPSTHSVVVCQSAWAQCLFMLCSFSYTWWSYKIEIYIHLLLDDICTFKFYLLQILLCTFTCLLFEWSFSSVISRPFNCSFFTPYPNLLVSTSITVVKGKFQSEVSSCVIIVLLPQQSPPHQSLILITP